MLLEGYLHILWALQWLALQVETFHLSLRDACKSGCGTNKPWKTNVVHPNPNPPSFINNRANGASAVKTNPATLAAERRRASTFFWSGLKIQVGKAHHSSCSWCRIGKEAVSGKLNEECVVCFFGTFFICYAKWLHKKVVIIENHKEIDSIAMGNIFSSPLPHLAAWSSSKYAIGFYNKK